MANYSHALMELDLDVIRAPPIHGGVEVDRFGRFGRHPTWLGYEELIG